MKINFIDITIKNFLSFGEIPTTFTYNTGIHAVIGKVNPGGGRNGVGKTSGLVDALSFVLYGKTVRKITKDKIINEKNEKNCVVTSRFDISGNNYKVERGISPNYLKVWENDTEIQYDSMANTQKWLEEKIQINYTAFCNIIILNINHSKPFLEMEPKEKRPVLEDILSLNVYASLLKVAKERHLTASNDVKTMEITLKSEMERCEESKKRKKKIDEQLNQFEQEKQVRLNSIEKDINLQKEELSKYEALVENVSYTEVITQLRNKLNLCVEKINTLKQSQYKFSKAIQDSNETLLLLKNKPHCPACKTPTDNPLIAEYITKTENTKLDSETKLKEVNATIERGNTAKLNIETKIKENTVLESKQRELSGKISLVKNKIEMRQKEFNKEKERKLELNSIITDEEIIEQEKQVKLSEELFKTTSNRSKYFKVIRGILGEEGISKYVVKKILPFLNKKANHYLSIFGSDYTILFDSELNEKLISKNRNERPYNSFSGGEKRRIDLSVLLAMIDTAKSQNSVDLNLLVLDEVLDTSMDSDGVQNFMDHISTNFKVSYPDKCVYIISHRKEISAEYFDSIINLVNEDGFTRIESITE
jgi:DNA repair exonuclease SbcCD ATPase subunit